MRFKKVYVEITNRCNFNCSYCCSSVREKRFVSPEDFSAILFSVKPYTDYIYLHVLGEPLLHPQLDLLLSEAFRQGFLVNLTTNGSLIHLRRELLLRSAIRQFNVSLHDAEENLPESRWLSYLEQVSLFAKDKSEDSYFSLRLWNRVDDDISPFNRTCLSFMSDFWGVDMSDAFSVRNKKLSDHVFFQNAARFTWPGEKILQVRRRTCYAMRDHVAILVDGTVVPCCLDANGGMSLGNVFEQPFSEIIVSERARNILDGFRRHEVVEPLCADCGFFVGE
jgi:Predicted Fe-S oxidoreductases